MTDTGSLSALVASRICHDLISPIGAIGNGLELLHMSAASGVIAGSEEMELISDCAATASESLQFMRIAFGSRPAEENISMREVATVAAAYFGRRKVIVHWNQSAEGTMRFRSVQSLLMMALCAVGTMPRGGVLTLTGNGSPSWTATGDSIRVTPRFLDLIQKRPDMATLTPGEVHHVLLWEHLASDGLRPSWQHTPNVGIIASQPMSASPRKHPLPA